MTNDRFILFPAAGIMLGMMLAADFAAAATASRMEAEAACASDAMRLCSKFIPNERRITACLHRNTRQLSSDCRTIMAPKKRARRR